MFEKFLVGTITAAFFSFCAFYIKQLQKEYKIREEYIKQGKIHYGKWRMALLIISSLFFSVMICSPIIYVNETLILLAYPMWAILVLIRVKIYKSKQKKMIQDYAENQKKIIYNCPDCGKRVKKNSVECKNCGCKLDWSDNYDENKIKKEESKTNRDKKTIEKNKVSEVKENFRQCKECGTFVKENAVSCPKCGTYIGI